MKILVLNFNLKGIGTYRRSFYFSRELARRGHNVTMFTVSRESKYRAHIYFKRDWIGQFNRPAGKGPWVRMVESPNLGYKWLPGWGSGPLDILLRIREIITGDYDVIYGFEYHPNVSWPVYITRPFLRYRFYSDWCDWFAGHSNWLRGWKIAHRIDGWLEERIRFLAQKVTVTSKTLYQRARGIGIPETRLVHIPEGAATDYIQPMPTIKAREVFGFPPDVPIVLTGVDWEIDRSLLIFAEVLKRAPDAMLIFLGREHPLAMQKAHKLGIAHRVHFTGWVSDEDYPRYIACADVCFLSLEDTLLHRARWPAKILDYLAAGRPVVTNGVGEVLDLFTQREVGVLALYDIEGMAEAIVALLRDPDRRSYLGQQARRVMEEEWDWQVRGERIARIVEE
ncbi:MAG: glycosyltransferase family 4 protein [Thermoflexales bacterium]|nr:glycosyltransferase family 4 protein [Thermoflexales bacterium]